MRYIFILLGWLSWTFGDQLITAVTENDPSSIVEGVSVITGDYYNLEEDYIIQGAEPFRIRRSYTSRDCGLRDFPHLGCSFLLTGVGCLVVAEPNGTNLHYFPDEENNIAIPEIGDDFYGKDKKKRKPLRYNAHSFVEKLPGVSNTSKGKLSAQTQLKNQYLVFDPAVNEKGKSFTLYCADGTLRKYVNLEQQEKVDFKSFGKAYLNYDYKLISETLPNGHVIQYIYNHKNQLKKIQTSSGDSKRVFAHVSFPALDPKNLPASLIFSGSDGRSVMYESGSASRSVSSPDFPKLNYAYVPRNGKMLLSGLDLPKGRKLQIEYDESVDHRVKSLASPVGPKGEMVATHSFFYDESNKNSYVIDAKGNKTAYFWNERYRLTQIDYFDGRALIKKSERFIWDGTQLRCKSLLDENQNPIFARTFSYDEKGNLKEETFYGNLSGKGVGLQLDEKGYPIQNGVERYVKKRWYTEDGRNLLLKERGWNGLKTVYAYRTDSQLLESKFVYEGDELKIHTAYEYDKDLLLIRETVDDGISKKIKRISPKNSSPYLGMPEIIEELYEENGTEILLQRAVLQYGTGAVVTQKDIYDSEGKFRYSLKSKYEKGRLLKEETNAIGQQAVYEYDEDDNRIYARDFSGRVTRYTYDRFNRLIEKEAEGWKYGYEYDVKNNLVAEIDPQGNKKRFIYDGFGHKTEINLPAIPDEKGKMQQPIIYQTYDSAGNEITKLDAEGNKTETQYNAYGKPTLVIHPDGTREEWTYYLDGTLKTHIDPKRIATSYIYDYLGRVIRKTLASQRAILAEESFEYTGQYLTAKTDAEGNRTLYSYDKAGRKIGEEFGEEKIAYSYDSLGRNTLIRQGELLAIKKYDLLDRVVEERNESTTGDLLRKVCYTHDAAGNVASITRYINGSEAREELRYDAHNRLIEKRDALEQIETIVYNDEFINQARQKVLQKTHTDPIGLQTIETRNAAGEIARVEKRREKTLFLEEKFYNKASQLSLQINTVLANEAPSRQVRIEWEYDSRGRLAVLREPEGKTTRYHYTPRGELNQLVKPNGVILSYTYNDLGYLTALSSSDRTVRHEMVYNRLGHLQQIDGIRRMTDPKGRLLSEIFPPHLSIQNRLDSQGRRVECVIPSANCLIEYSYNPTDLLSVSRKSLNGKLFYQHHYVDRDLSGNLLSQELIGHLGTVQYSFDPLSRTTAVLSPHFSQEILQYDAVGNICEMEVQKRKLSFTYDPLYQLISEEGHTYLYDSIHTRLQSGKEQYETNGLQQIISHFAYDENGNPVQSGDTSYSYDALDRLIRLETPLLTQTFTYDALHRRLSKTTIQNNTEQTVYFLYDGQNEIGSFSERLSPIEFRVLGSTPHAEIGAAVAVELLSQIYAPIHDLQGNVAVLIPVSQEEKPFYFCYNAFGEGENGSANPWRFSSKRTDLETGLVYFGRRYYLPFYGRWLTPDPAGFTDGMNLYAFVHNNPLSHFDLYGLTAYHTDWQIPGSKYSFKPPEPILLGKPGRFNYNPSYSPNYYVNGIKNTRHDSLRGASTLFDTFKGGAGVVPFYSDSFGTFKDLWSVDRARKNPQYTSFAVRTLKRQLQWDMLCLDAMNDPRKIFITAFSRGAGDTYHAAKDFSFQQRQRLIITACGPIMILPRNLGFQVTNLISEGDWCSRFLNRGLIRNPKKFSHFANVFILDEQDRFKWYNKGHFFINETYQEGIRKHTSYLYETHGVLK